MIELVNFFAYCGSTLFPVPWSPTVSWCWIFDLIPTFLAVSPPLKDPTDKKSTICDDKLKELFEVNSSVGFSVSEVLTAHFHQDRTDWWRSVNMLSPIERGHFYISCYHFCSFVVLMLLTSSSNGNTSFGKLVLAYYAPPRSFFSYVYSLTFRVLSPFVKSFNGLA